MSRSDRWERTKVTNSSFFFTHPKRTFGQEYMKEFSRLSLMASDLDDESRTLLFVRGLLPASGMKQCENTLEPCPKRCALPEWPIDRFLWLTGMINGEIVRVTDDLPAGSVPKNAPYTFGNFHACAITGFQKYHLPNTKKTN